MSEEKVEAIRQLYERWTRGDFSVGSELWDPDIECVVDVGAGGLDFVGSTRGTEAMADLWRKQLQAWQDYRVGEIEELIEAGDQVVVVSRHWAKGSTAASR